MKNIRTVSFPVIGVALFQFALLPMYVGNAEWKVYWSEAILALGAVYTALVIRESAFLVFMKKMKYIPLILYALSVSTLLWSPCKQKSLASILWLTAIYLWAFVLLSLKEKEIKVVLVLAVFSGFCFAVFSLLQYIGFYPHEYWPNKIRLSGTFTNSNHFASYLTLIFPAGIAFSLKRVHPVLRTVFLLGSLPCLMALILTISRGGWAEAFLAGLLFIALCPFQKKRWRIVLLLLFLIAAGTLIGLAWELGWTRAVMERLKGSGTYSVSHRIYIWKDTLGMILQKPQGTGIGTYPLVFPVYRTFSDRFVVNAAHNDLLEFTSEIGIIGLLLLFAVAILWAFPVLGFLTKGSDDEKENRILSAGLFSAVTAVFFQAFFDFALQKAAVALLFFLYAVSCFRLAQKDEWKDNEMNHGARLSVFLLPFALALLIFSSLLAIGDMKYRSALKAGEDLLGDLSPPKKGVLKSESTKTASGTPLGMDEVLNLYREAFHYSLGNCEYAKSAGRFCAQMASRFPLGWKKNLNEAEHWYTMATGKHPFDAESHYALAGICQIAGDPIQAEKEFRAAIYSDPAWGEYWEKYGEFLLRRGEVEKGLETYRRAIELFPTSGNKKRPFAKFLTEPSVPLDVAGRIFPRNEETAVAVFKEFINLNRAKKGLEILKAMKDRLPESAILRIGAQIDKAGVKGLVCEFYEWAYREYKDSRSISRRREECSKQ